MKEGTNLTVVASEYGYIPEGTTLTVTRDHTNQFSGRRTITVRPPESVDIPNRLAGDTIQFNQNDDGTWTEVLVGMDREHEVLTLQETEVIA